MASRRTLSVPSNMAVQLQKHLDEFVLPNGNALLFTMKSGAPLTRGVLQQARSRARISIGRPDLHLHDLRHTVLTLAAATGATPAELMHRAGHALSLIHI